MTNTLDFRRLAVLLLSLAFLLPTPDRAAAQRPARDARPTTTTATPAGRPQATSARRNAASAASTTRPRLVLLIVVDQFRYDFLERFGDLFGAGGLRRLQRAGASWTNANYDHIPTETAPGHATLLTGTWPSENGIIGNQWFDRASGKIVSNVSDESATLIGGGATEPASSPRRMLVSTLADELRIVSQGRSKAIGISVKDRAAILTVGRHASAAYWYSSNTGQMVSSTYYFNRLPDWVVRFNNSKPADAYFGKTWARLKPESLYNQLSGDDRPSWEDIGTAKDTNFFPHVITGGASACCDRNFYGALNYSPFSNDLLLDFAERAITNEALGADADTDVLSVSFSANDYVGHRFGPYSHEAMDMTLRVDESIAALLNFVDARVGLQHTLVVFTADHGCAPTPEHAASLNLPGERIKPAALRSAICNAIKTRYDRACNDKGESEYILGFENEYVYFNPVTLKRDNIAREEIERIVGEAAMTVPGIRRFFTRTQLERGAISPNDVVARRALHGFNAQRSGDVLVMPEPYKYLNEYGGATHGSPYSYDTHVPLVIMGGGIAPGRYAQAAAPSDIAPTLATLLRMPPPSNVTGRVLTEGIK